MSRDTPLIVSSRRRTLLMQLAAVGGGLFIPPALRAATFPGSRPIRLVVAYPTGGTSDIVSRALAAQLGKQMNVSFVVENKGGAGGQLGTAEVVRAAADGYTIGWIAESPLTIAPHLGALPYKFEDVAPVSSVMFSPLSIVATPAFKGKTFQDFIDQAKTNPGAIRIGRTGDGTPAHLMIEQLQRATGAKFTQVPYRGGGQMTTDALGGTFEVLISNPDSQTVQLCKSGRFNLLAVGAIDRIDDFPEVRTLAQLGYGTANLMSTYGIIAPPKTPQPIIDLLNAEIAKALKSPEVLKTIAATESIPYITKNADEFGEYLKKQHAMYGRLIQLAGIKTS